MNTNMNISQSCLEPGLTHKTYMNMNMKFATVKNPNVILQLTVLKSDTLKSDKSSK
jgi:hypothetical protein